MLDLSVPAGQTYMGRLMRKALEVPNKPGISEEEEEVLEGGEESRDH